MTRIATMLSLLLLPAALTGCGQRPAPPVATPATGATAPAATTPAGPAKLEVDADLEKAGITVTEKLRDGKKLVLLVGSTERDFESSNFNCVLLDGAGKELSKTGLSIPKFAKGESFEWEMEDEQLPNARRIVIKPLAKKDDK